MSLTGLQSRFMVASFGHRTSMMLALGLGLTACGPQFSKESSESKGDAAVTQNYQEWCQEWQLTCPATDPGKTNPLSAAQWKAISSLASGALQSPSVLSLNRQDMDSATLKQAFTALHLDDIYADIQTRLNDSQWQSGGLESGALVSHSAVASSFKTDSGIALNLDTMEKIQLSNDGLIRVAGVGLGADAAKDVSALQSIQMGEDGSFQLALSDRTITQVPMEFAMENLLLAFGLDTGKLEGKDIAIQDVVAAGGPLIGWLNQGSRQIALDRAFFANAASQLGVLIPTDDLGKNLGNLLNTFDKLRTSADAKNNLATVTMTKGATANCDMNNGDVKIKFAAEFGVKRYYQVNPTTLGIELYGLSASAKKALGITIKLKRVELGPEKITILDVPVIGKVEMKWDEVAKPDQKTTLVCGA